MGRSLPPAFGQGAFLVMDDVFNQLKTEINKPKPVSNPKGVAFICGAQYAEAAGLPGPGAYLHDGTHLTFEEYECQFNH